MKITRLIKKSGPYFTILPLTQTPAEVRAQSDLNVRMYLELTEVVGKTEPVTLDLSLLFLETALGQMVTWADCLAGLTEVMVEAYATSTVDPENPQVELRPISVSNIEELEMSYTSLKSYTERNIPQFKWRLTDLVLTKVDPRLDVQFDQCLCSVNGLINQPVLFQNELYIPDGARYLQSCHTHHWPEVVLLDFSQLGTCTFVPFSQCQQKYHAPYDQAHSYAQGDLELILPTGIDLSQKTVLMVVAHTLYFPDQIRATTDHSVMFTAWKYPIHSSLVRREMISNKYIPYTDVVQTDNSVEDYLRTEMFQKEHRGAFFVLIDNPTVGIKRTPCQVINGGRNLLSFDTPGILVQQSTGAIVDYRNEEYTSEQFLYLNEPLSVYRTDDGFLERQVGVGYIDCVHQDRLSNYRDSAYEMVHLVTQG